MTQETNAQRVAETFLECRNAPGREYRVAASGSALAENLVGNSCSNFLTFVAPSGILLLLHLMPPLRLPLLEAKAGTGPSQTQRDKGREAREKSPKNYRDAAAIEKKAREKDTVCTAAEMKGGSWWTDQGVRVCALAKPKEHSTKKKG